MTDKIKFAEGTKNADGKKDRLLLEIAAQVLMTVCMYGGFIIKPMRRGRCENQDQLALRRLVEQKRDE